MFKKLKSDKSSKSSKNSESLATPPQSRSSSTTGSTQQHLSNGHHIPSTAAPNLDSLKVEVTHIESTINLDNKPYDTELDFKVINPSQPELPYGDGSDKVFGMENFGYTCYCNSILQCLYYTKTFKEEILSFPKRDPNNPRQRRVKVPGARQHPFITSLQQSVNSSNGGNGNNNSNSSSNNGNGNEKSKKKGLFGMKSSDSSSSGNSNNNNNNGMSNGSNSNSSNSNGNNKDNKDNKEVKIFSKEELNNKDLQALMTTKYPAFKNLNLTYFFNSQKSLSVVGTVLDPNATSESRKRQALIDGPIINLDHSYNSTYGMEQSLFTTLKDTFECMTETLTKTGVVSPHNLVEVVKRENEMFRSSMHQDAHEFINFLINNVLETIDSSTTNSSSSIHEIFEGLLTSETKCLSCENVSTRDEKFLDLSIDLLPNSSISNCLRMFSQSEMLNESNKFHCEKCHSLQEAAKTIKLKKLPKVLILHLKRFKYTEELNRNIKLFYRVEYPKSLRIFNTTEDTESPDKLYELYGVVVHIGGGPYHGHYVAMIKTQSFGWLLFDDETVESIDENYVFRFFGDGPGLATAYILFYQEVLDEEKFREKDLYNGLDGDDSDMEIDNFPITNSNIGNNNNNHKSDTDNSTLADSIAQSSSQQYSHSSSLPQQPPHIPVSSSSINSNSNSNSNIRKVSSSSVGSSSTANHKVMTPPTSSSHETNNIHTDEPVTKKKSRMSFSFKKK